MVMSSGQQLKEYLISNIGITIICNVEHIALHRFQISSLWISSVYCTAIQGYIGRAEDFFCPINIHYSKGSTLTLFEVRLVERIDKSCFYGLECCTINIKKS